MIDEKDEFDGIEESAQPVVAGQRSLSDMLRALSDQDFLTFGVDQVAYVRPMKLNARDAFAVCGADGRGLSVHLTESAAMAAMKAGELRPMRIH